MSLSKTLNLKLLLVCGEVDESPFTTRGDCFKWISCSLSEWMKKGALVLPPLAREYIAKTLN